MLDEADPAPDATTFELAYEGYPPRLTAPKARLDKHVLPLACGAEQQGQWFFERFACEDPDAVPRIEPRGCLGALSAAARDRARKVLAGGPRDEFLALLRKTGNVWIPNVGISKGACRQFTLKPGKDRLVLFPLDGDHSHEIKLLDGGAISFGEAFDDNPHAKKSRSRDSGIALGCCSKPTSYRVLSVDAGTARLQAPDREVTWAFSRRTCKPE